MANGHKNLISTNRKLKVGDDSTQTRTASVRQGQMTLSIVGTTAPQCGRERPPAASTGPGRAGAWAAAPGRSGPSLDAPQTSVLEGKTEGEGNDTLRMGRAAATRHRRRAHQAHAGGLSPSEGAARGGATLGRDSVRGGRSEGSGSSSARPGLSHRHADTGHRTPAWPP